VYIQIETKMASYLDTLPIDVSNIIYRKVFNESIKQIPRRARLYYKHMHFHYVCKYKRICNEIEYIQNVMRDKELNYGYGCNNYEEEKRFIELCGIQTEYGEKQEEYEDFLDTYI
jgi:hypothetical protein